MSSNIYLVPYWIYESLKRHKIPLTDLTNIGKIRRVLSMNDLLGLEKLQGERETVFGCQAGSGTFQYEWSQTAKSQEDLDFIHHQLFPLLKTPLQEEEVKERLFSDSYVIENKKPYEVLALEDRALAIVLYPGSFKGVTGQSTQLDLIRSTLKQLYVYEKHTSVAKLPLTRRYLELLSVQKH